VLAQVSNQTISTPFAQVSTWIIKPANSKNILLTYFKFLIKGKHLAITFGKGSTVQCRQKTLGQQRIYPMSYSLKL
jgi:hypothetical protein